jgi:hypothetical protein
MINGLTKENFFNAMMEKYPSSMKVFCEWIDQFKESDYIVFHSCNHDGQPMDFKFHDLPFEYQIGIVQKFAAETMMGEGGWEAQCKQFAVVVEGMLRALESRLNPFVPEPPKEGEKLWTIWQSGYAATGEDVKASKVGEEYGFTFDDAVAKYITRLQRTTFPEVHKHYTKQEIYVDCLITRENPHGRKLAYAHSIWACSLHDNEADARKVNG